MCDIQELTSIVDTLQQLSARFYGPQCAQTLLTSNTGKAVVTSDGLTILEAVLLSHPMANMVVTSLKKCHAVTYDGSKTFLLYLKFFLKHLKASIEVGKFSGRGTNNTFTNSSYYKHSKVCAAKTVRSALIEVLPELYQDLQNHKSVKQFGSGNVIEILSRVCQATLLPHFNIRLSKHLAEILTRVLPKTGHIEAMRVVLQFEILKFSQLIVKVPGRNYRDCTVFEPFLLKKSKMFKNFMQQTPASHPKAICVQMSSEVTEDQDPDIGMIVNHRDQIHGSLLVRRKVVERFAETCQNSNIELIICSDSLPSYAIDILHKHRLSVLTNVLKEDIDMLELFTHTTSVVSFLDEMNEINILSLTGVDEVTVGNDQFVHVKADVFSFKHVVVCAPGPGLCDQTALLLQKALNAMYLSLECSLETDGSLEDTIKTKGNLVGDIETGGKSGVEIKFNGSLAVNIETSGSFQNADLTHERKYENPNDRSTLYGPNESFKGKTDLKTLDNHQDVTKTSDKVAFKVVPAGGAFEVMMSKLLKDESKTADDPHVKETCLVLSQALIDVVNTLHENTSRGRHQSRSRFIHIQTQLYDRMDAGKSVGLNRCGDVCDLEQDVFLEPLMTKIHILESVLSLVAQLLRIDNVIATKKACTLPERDDY